MAELKPFTEMQQAEAKRFNPEAAKAKFEKDQAAWKEAVKKAKAEGKPLPRAPRDPLAALERAWERYHGNVTALVKEGVTDENRSKVVSTIRKHAQVIESLREKVA